MRLFGTSGIRRLVDKELFTLAYEVGLAVGNVYDKVIIGRDTRTSGSALQHAMMAGLLSGGAECSNAGIIPTPTLAFAAKEFKAGVMLTASHNPPEYNDIKLLNPDGSAFSGEQQQHIEEAMQHRNTGIAAWDKLKEDDMYPDAAAGHAEYILKNFPHDLKLKVVVDCGGAAAFWITPYILRALGCEVIALNCLPAGVFPHDVEPVEANLGELMRTVRDSGADLGIAHDGDADRMMAVDNRGRFISGDKMLALLAKAGAAREIVTTIDASMSIEEMGFKVVRTRVGDPYVSAELKKNGFAFGGEPSGAWVFPAVSYCPDGIYAAVLIAVAAGQQNLAELVDNIPTYPVRRGSVKGRGIPLRELENGLMVLEPVSLIRADGLKLGFNDGWLLVRPSGTEPKIRISAEAKSEARVRQLYDAGVEAAQNCVALHPGEIRRIE